MDMSKIFNNDFIFLRVCLSNIDNPYDRDVLRQILNCTKNDAFIVEERYINNRKYALVKNTDGVYFCQKRGKLFFNPHGCANNRVNMYDILESQLNDIFYYAINQSDIDHIENGVIFFKKKEVVEND